MKKTLPIIVCLCLLLSGCSNFFDGSYYHEEPHTNQGSQLPQGSVIASNYEGLCIALTNMVENGSQSGIITVATYDQSTIYTDLSRAVTQVRTTNPIAAWAVEDIKWELGSNGGQLSVAFNISYIHDRTEIRNVHRVSHAETAKSVITGALNECGNSVQILISGYTEIDFQQLVDSYADAHPEMVMECPQVVVHTFPETGSSRLVDLKFTYENSRDALRIMQEQVRTVFDSATLFVSSYNTQAEKFQQLYAFLMEFLVEGDYQLETSITPAYSLLRHGVGDKKAFATVYAAMCHRADLECLVITGTRDGEPWTWNMVCDDGNYYHVDLLRSAGNGFQELTDDEMEGYVWDYSAYPKAEK